MTIKQHFSKIKLLLSFLFTNKEHCLNHHKDDYIPVVASMTSFVLKTKHSTRQVHFIMKLKPYNIIMEQQHSFYQLNQSYKVHAKEKLPQSHD